MNWDNDVHKTSNYTQPDVPARGSITTHTPLALTTYQYNMNAQPRPLASDEAVERLGLGLSGVTLCESNESNRPLMGRALTILDTRRAPSRSVAFAVEGDNAVDDDGWEADTEMHIEIDDINLYRTFDTMLRLCGGQRRFRKRASRCRNRPPTPYHAPNGKDSWLGM